jgi:predicted signal transduction protein with EAL and GGDEF domain
VLSLSVGKATYPDDGGDAETLLAAADRSLYAMKRSRPGMARAQAAK